MNKSFTSERILEFSRVNQLAVIFQNSNPKNKTMAAIDFRDPDLLNFLRKLQEINVRYILVDEPVLANFKTLSLR